MHKRIISVILIFTLIICLTPVVTVAGASTPYVSMEQAEKEANDLKTLGLFTGTNKGFELNRAPTRLEGLVMLIRLMGYDEEARTCEYGHPFKDVPAWGKGYVAWAYFQGYTSGTSATTFRQTP